MGESGGSRNAGFSVASQRLLVSLLRPDAKSEARPLADVSALQWDQMTRLSQQLGVAPLLYKRLTAVTSPGVPAAVIKVVRQSYYTNAARHLLLARELTEILLGLAERGIQVVVLKGLAVAETLYENPVGRLTGDLDILVRPGDVQRAIQVLTQLGYRALASQHDRFDPFHTSYMGELPLQKEGALLSVLVEIHWELIPTGWFRQLTALDMDRFWDNAIPLTLNSVEVHQLAPEDLLIYLCCHLAIHSFGHFRSLLDIDRAVAQFPQDVWVKLLSRAAEFRVKNTADFGLLTAQQLLDTPVPSAVLARLNPGRVRSYLFNWIVQPHRLDARATTPARLRRLLLHLLSSDRLSGIISLFRWMLFPGRAWLAEHYQLTGNRWSILFSLIHPMLVLAQAVGDAGRLVTDMLRRQGATSHTAASSQ